MPASVGLVSEVRDELVAQIQSVRTELKGEIQGLRTEVKKDIHDFRTEFGVAIQQILVASHRTQAIVEEQRAENRVVLDGLHNVNERLDRLEADNVEIHRFLRTLTIPRT